MPAATRTFPCVLGPSGWLYSCRLRALNRDLASQGPPSLHTCHREVSSGHPTLRKGVGVSIS